jgi:hypothetical protein
MNTPPRYMISKGWEGFADRMQCLSYCLSTAKLFNRTLYVDWTDTIWRDGFYKYFHWVDLPNVSQVAVIDEELAVYPHFWKHKLILPANEWVYDIKEELVFEPKTGRHYEGVWVHPGIGYREYDMPELCSHLRLNRNIKKAIVPTDPDIPLVHLRGNDRSFTEEQWETLREKAPIALVVSDDAKLVQRWLKESPLSVVLSQPKEGMYHKTITPSKHDMNMAILRDFIAVSKAKEAYALNDESIFFKMARIMNTDDWRN